jgi:hypothetical protein
MLIAGHGSTFVLVIRVYELPESILVQPNGIGIAGDEILDVPGPGAILLLRAWNGLSAQNGMPVIAFTCLQDSQVPPGLRVIGIDRENVSQRPLCQVKVLVFLEEHVA